MDANQRKHFGFLVLIAIALFTLYALPNAAASKNLAMVQVFSADESLPLPTVLRMVAPSGSLEQTAKNFIFYGYYPYGLVYFAWSAAVVYPLQWLGLSGNTAWVMLVLRQMVSVLPMLAALMFLVFLQDGFRTYRSYILFVFLAVIPAVVQNNLWWHPDGLVTLFAVLTLFFLVRDRLRFGAGFYIAALACGLAIGTKLVGVFFFLAVAVYLLLGIVQKKASWPRLLRAGGLFILVMAATYLLTNPYLFFASARAEFIKTMIGQGASLSTGYGVVYAKGIIASWPIVREFFGEAVFILAAIACTLWGILRGTRRILYLLIFAWFIPLSLTVFFFSHFKFQYWLPAILPVIS